MRDYDKIYENLGIKIAPLGENYDPETYGRELMRGMYCSDEVSYSSSTNYVPKTLDYKCEIERSVLV